MPTFENMHIILLLPVIAVGGVCLLVGPFVSPSMRSVPLWLKAAICMAGIAAEAYLALRFAAIDLGGQNKWYPLVSHLRSFVGGIGVGLLLTYLLFAINQYSQRARERDARNA